MEKKEDNKEEKKDDKKEVKEEKEEKKDKAPQAKKKEKAEKEKEKVEPASFCMQFCRSEPPASPPEDDKKKKKRGQSRERKDELNKGARAPSRERPCKEKDKEQQCAKDDAKKEKQKKLSPKETKAKLELQKRQEKPISFIDCPICHKVYKHAVEIECGHVFCCSCLRKKMRRNKLCPICQSEIEYVHPSYVMRELVDKFGVKDGPKRLKTELLQVSGYYDEYATEDPIVIASQFIAERPGGCCTCNSGGAFDPADLYKIARLDEYVSIEEYLDTIKMVNQIIASWTSGPIKACFGTLCCCLFPSQAQKAVNMIEVVLGDCNLRWPETGLFWTLMYMDGDTASASSLGEKFFLALRIDPSKARAYQNSLRAGKISEHNVLLPEFMLDKKDVEMARLRKQNALMRHKMLELGENGLVRTLAGRRSPRYSLKSGASLSFSEEYPDYPVISPHTLRDLVLHNPASKKYFIAPWNRMRSTSTGPLPLTRDEDCRIRSHLASITSRSSSPFVDRGPARSPSPASRAKSPNSDRSRPWR